MSMTDSQKLRRIEELRKELAALENEPPTTSSDWPPKGFYGSYYATTGFMLGGIGALTSLLANVLAAPAAGKSPLELIKVYLTFPFGQRALELSSSDGALILALGCTLYVGTGMVLGVPMYWALARICGSNPPLAKRMAVASVLSLALYALNFYVLLSWLQPALFGGRWITDPAVLPPWVAAVTHLIFGWTLAVIYPLGQFTPYRQPGRESSAG
jgi:hypothetical protein